MRILISPAKKMNADPEGLPPSGSPRFLDEARTLLQALRDMDYKALKALWACNDAIAGLNAERLLHMDLERGPTPAVLAYEGIQYRYMAPSVFEKSQFTYIDEHLRILSGFYGLLKPFDGVTPYRLEMQAKLRVGGCADLYGFWGDKLARALTDETDTLLNLASKEYGRAVTAHLPRTVRLVDCVFGERKGDKVIEKGTMCKMARGEMVRFLAERGSVRPEETMAFDRLGYAYSEELSQKDRLVFLRQEAEGERFP